MKKGRSRVPSGQRKGRFEIADKGTIFLDEVGDVPPAMQAKLLRVLPGAPFRALGGSESIEVDVRVVAATNRPLQRLVKQGKFREDLYYRLNVVRFDLPPLRERSEDIPLLATHFTQKYARPHETTKMISPAAMQVLVDYSWPGNVRQLENAIKRACVTSPTNIIDVVHLPAELVQPVPEKLPFDVSLARPLQDLLRDATKNIEQRYLPRLSRRPTAACSVPPRSAVYRAAASLRRSRSMASIALSSKKANSNTR